MPKIAKSRKFLPLKYMERIVSQMDSSVQTVWSYSENIGRKFDIDKCTRTVLELEIGRLVRSERIEFPDGERMKEEARKGISTLGYFSLIIP